MSHTVVTADATLIKRIRNQMLVIGVLTVIVIGFLFYYFFNRSRVIPDPKTKTVKFIREVDDKTAKDGIGNYTSIVLDGTVIDSSQGVLFDSSEIRNYLDNIYPQIIARHDTHRGANPIPAGYQWKLAFYWMVRENETGTKRLGLYVAPVLFNSTTKDVKNYFDVTENLYYKHPTGMEAKNIYDEGHLWP